MRLLCHACVAEQVDGNPQHVTQPRKRRRNASHQRQTKGVAFWMSGCMRLLAVTYEGPG